MRLFIAIALPGDIASAASRLLPELPAVRRVRPELMHITLAFLGAVPEERLADVAAAADSAAMSRGPFALELDHLGRFPVRGRPHTIWLGAGTGADEILALGARLRDALDAKNVSYDAKPMRAHVTLGRVRDGTDSVEARDIAAALRGLKAPRLRFRVDTVVVFESVLSPKGPRYTTRSTASLRMGGQG